MNEKLDLREFFEAMSGDREPLTLAIRAAIFVEHQLIEFVQARVRNPEALDRMRLGFVGRMELAIALGLNKDYRAPIKVLADIRNKFAHRPDAELDEEDTKRFEAAFSKTEHDALKRTYLSIAPGRQARTFNDLITIEKFVFMAVTLHSALGYECDTAPR